MDPQVAVSVVARVLIALIPRVATVAAKLIAKIEKARSSAPFNRVLTALAIRGTGRTMCGRIAAVVPSLAVLRQMTTERLTVSYVGPMTEAGNLNTLRRHIALLGGLRKTGQWRAGRSITHVALVAAPRWT